MDVALPDGMTVTTYSPPPGFNPLTAGDADLAKNGFPPRPGDPVHLARWNKVMNSLTGKLNYITPTFRVEENVKHGPRVRSATAGTDVSGNWSGGVVPAPAGESFHCVNGDWVIPAVDAPTDNQWYFCASWVGIDGDGDGAGATQVCQAGIGSQVYNTGSSVTASYYPWWEWYPGPSVAITNFPIAPGDMVTLLLVTSGAGATSATAYFANRTTGVSTSVTFTAPGGTVLFGGCAEWIVEAPQVNGQQSLLADYGQVFFNDCFAVAANPSQSTTVDSNTGDNINMYANLANPNSEVSAATLYTPTVVECEYVGTLP